MCQDACNWPKETKGEGFNLNNGLYLMGGHELGLTSGPCMMWHFCPRFCCTIRDFVKLFASRAHNVLNASGMHSTLRSWGWRVEFILNDISLFSSKGFWGPVVHMEHYHANKKSMEKMWVHVWPTLHKELRSKFNPSEAILLMQPLKLVPRALH
jgi:hypothetical protein